MNFSELIDNKTQAGLQIFVIINVVMALVGFVIFVVSDSRYSKIRDFISVLLMGLGLTGVVLSIVFSIYNCQNIQNIVKEKFSQQGITLIDKGDEKIADFAFHRNKHNEGNICKVEAFNEKTKRPCTVL